MDKRQDALDRGRGREKVMGPRHRDWNVTRHFKPVLHPHSRSQCEEWVTWWISIEDSKAERGRDEGEARREKGQGSQRGNRERGGERTSEDILCRQRAMCYHPLF